VIILDYSFPLPSTLMRSVVFIIERIAGGDHYRNFKKYNKLGGIDYFIYKSGLKPVADSLRGRTVFRIVSCRSGRLR
ncbi:MAG: hypothetical protein ACLFN1_09700, partial [Bacteroidales bacterium]